MPEIVVVKAAVKQQFEQFMQRGRVLFSARPVASEKRHWRMRCCADRRFAV